MLDHLDLLDDPAPIAPDDATLANVHARANGLRRRTQLTGLAAIVAGLVLVVGVAAFAQGRDREVNVIAPPNTTTTPTTSAWPTSEGKLANGLHIKLTVEPTIVLGRLVTMTAEVRNDTDTTKTIGGGSAIPCAISLSPALRDYATGELISHDGDYSCHPVGRPLAPGETIWARSSLSTYPVVLAEDQRRGQYEVGLTPLSGTGHTWVIPPVRVDVIAPELSGKLEIPKTDFAAGETVHGTLVLTNATSRPIEYPVGCAVGDWDVALGQDRTTFPVPTEETEPCYPRNEAPRKTFPRGTSRTPFTVPLMSGEVGTPPGEYQLLFRGLGPFGSLEIAPLTIQVR